MIETEQEKAERLMAREEVPVLEEAAASVISQALYDLDEWGPYHSLHEAFGVLWEEFRELEAEMMKKQYKRELEIFSGLGHMRDKDNIRKEATQIASVALRIAADAERMASK